ncbi:MAG: xanthine dehydrogenase family protein molybdopterin-binding subunit [Aestuariivirga sp.]|uniref:xanthine dehydrogenase family protein molybdopterin-binding subunit n=1 Tax=Aestuariivirga sp. TaxID=2650926 RepID=UPI0025BADECC|nr:xanthine dehydrogenase family protein molybdopterin-binding subunit [Aestuariivirga sp.]MCA3560891.1 xanthine dehydrogenase family protein molybdopterin-binding subunit [Aestuariivirga sp.]
MYPKLFDTFSAPLASVKPSRRSLVLGALASGLVLSVGFRWQSSAQAQEAAKPHPFNPYISIAADGKITIYSSQFEMGQGAYFGIATLVNEELDADWAQINVVGGFGDVAAFGNLAWGGAAQGTGGSTSMTSSWERYRTAGAALRMMLAEAASKAWGVPVSEVSTARGIVSHPSGKTATYAELVTAASALLVPATVPLKPRTAWTQIGKAGLKRYDSRMKTDGSAQFTIDVKLPGMATAVIIHPPKFGATVASFDASKAKDVKGFVDAVQISRGVAVVAENMWSALKARDLVSVAWIEDKAEQRNSADILVAYETQSKAAPLAVARNDGDAAGALAAAGKVLEASFSFPYLAHAALEPLNAVASMTDGTLEIWGGHQMPDLYQYIGSQIAGTTPDKVKLHVMKTGGGFGRRAVFDADVVAEAVETAKALAWSRPVKVQWTRENDMRGGRYRPAYVHAMKAGLDKDGKIIAWSNHIVGQSIMSGTLFEGMAVKNGVDFTSVEGAANVPYDIPNVAVGLSTMQAGVPVLWWRAVGSTHTAYAVETFLDEVAEAAGKDPVALRLELLDKHPRHMAALKLAAEKAGWDKPAAEGRFRGVAVAESFGSVVAQIAEISIPSPGQIKVERVVCAVDCGTAINPDQVAAQMEGGIGFGLSSILGEEITLTAGAVDQGNYDSYTPLRIEQMPKVEVHIVPSEGPPTGAGEPGVPPAGPALANAVYQATRKRIRTLPFSKGFTA